MSQGVAEQRPWTIQGVMKALGPGILFAGAAIGGSHLLQSTQAGAYYGWGLLWAVLLANLFKYPFFEFVYRYLNATGDSILSGYNRRGKVMMALVFLIVTGGGLLNAAAVAVVAAALFGALMNYSFDLFAGTVVVTAISFTLILVGRYPALDKVIKVIMGLLAVTTLLAFAFALAQGGAAPPGFSNPFVWDAVSIGFLLALMGWMPAPIDVGIWPSLWARERAKETQYDPTGSECLADFYIGYVSTAIMAIFFLGLGALVMYGSGEEVAKGLVPFSKQLVALYTESLGDWSRLIVAIAVFTCMFSTTLTCLDGFPRTTYESFNLLFNRQSVAHRGDWVFWGTTLLYILFILIVAYGFQGSLLRFVQIAMLIAFLTAPLMAIFNYLVIMSPEVPATHRPPLWLQLLSWLGILYLLGFAILFLVNFFSSD